MFFTLQTFLYGIATYLMIWVFWNSQDFPLSTYRYAFISASVLIGFGLTSFITWYKFKIERLEGIARNLIRFTYSIEKLRGYILPEKITQYKKERTIVINKALEDE